MNLERHRCSKKQNLQRTTLAHPGRLFAFFACRLTIPFTFDIKHNRIPESKDLDQSGIGHYKWIARLNLHALRASVPLFFMWLPVVIWGRRRLPSSLF